MVWGVGGEGGVGGGGVLDGAISTRPSMMHLLALSFSNKKILLLTHN